MKQIKECTRNGRKENTRFTWKTLEQREKTTIDRETLLLFSQTMKVTTTLQALASPSTEKEINLG